MTTILVLIIIIFFTSIVIKDDDCSVILFISVYRFVFHLCYSFLFSFSSFEFPRHLVLLHLKSWFICKTFFLPFYPFFVFAFVKVWVFKYECMCKLLCLLLFEFFYILQSTNLLVSFVSLFPFVVKSVHCTMLLLLCIHLYITI